MTRKDYIALADTILAAKRATPDTDATILGIDIATRSIADALAADNPRFDRARFLAACGVAPAPATTGAEG